MDFSKKRWLSLIAAMLTGLFAGIGYSWSVYVNPLVAKYGWTMAEISLAWSINMIFMAIAPIALGRLRARFKTSQYILLGSVLYCSGIVMCSLLQKSVLELYLYYGLLLGSGCGLVYLSLASYVVQLFPDKKGLAAGFFTAAFGGGALFWAPIASYIMTLTGNVDMAFRILGLSFLVLMIISTRFLYEVPAGYEGEKLKAGNKGANAVKTAVRDFTSRQMLGSFIYYVLLFLFSCAFISGLTIMSMGSPIVEKALNYSREGAAFIVGLLALSSTLGRLVWGFLSDRLGRLAVLLIVSAGTCICLISLMFISREAFFLSALLLIPFCYGAYTALLSPVVVETFGTRHFFMNYNFLFISYSIAGLIGPQVAARVMDAAGDYQAIFFYTAIFAGASLLLTFLFICMLKRQAQHQV